MALSVDIEKRFDDFELKVKFEAGNEILSILGASGCGKSMTLKCIAGIEKPDKGKIVMDGVTLFDSEKKINLPPQKRKVGYLFQQYALFPNMTVEQNIACGVREKNQKDRKVKELLRVMNLEGLEKHKPEELSGGQQQRVALARILANEPEVLLLDEPFSALDAFLRFQLEQEVHKIMREFGKTVIFVSHDRDETYRLSDRIATMQNGKVETIGEKNKVFYNPRTRNSAILTGCKNISKAQLVDENHVYAEAWDWKLRVAENISKLQYIGIRMHDIKIVEESMENSMECQVVGEIEHPFSYTIFVSPMENESGEQIGVQVKKEEWEENKKDRIIISISAESILILEE